jgi:hypothetical protein
LLYASKKKKLLESTTVYKAEVHKFHDIDNSPGLNLLGMRRWTNQSPNMLAALVNGMLWREGIYVALLGIHVENYTYNDKNKIVQYLV